MVVYNDNFFMQYISFNSDEAVILSARAMFMIFVHSCQIDSHTTQNLSSGYKPQLFSQYDS